MLRRSALLLMLATAAAPAAAQAPPSDTEAIRAVVDGIDMAVDAKDWPAVRAFFADRVEVDFTSLAGGQPATIPADALVEGWRQSLPPEKTSLHMRTNHRIAVRGDTAEVVSHGYAFNRLAARPLGDALWEVWGVYTHRLARSADGWRVTGMRLQVTHARGNEAVVQYRTP